MKKKLTQEKLGELLENGISEFALDYGKFRLSVFPVS